MNGQLERIARRGALPAGAFGVLQQEELAAAGTCSTNTPRHRSSGRWCCRTRRWITCRGLDESLQKLADWLGGLRAGTPAATGAGWCCTTAAWSKTTATGATSWCPSGSPTLRPIWRAWSITSRIISKAGNVTLQRRWTPRMRASWWSALAGRVAASAWRPLPLALQTAFAWLDAGGDAGRHCVPGRGATGSAQGLRRRPLPGLVANVRFSDYLALRAYPNSTCSGPTSEFGPLKALALLKPLSDAVGNARIKAAKGTPAAKKSA